MNVHVQAVLFKLLKDSEKVFGHVFVGIDFRVYFKTNNRTINGEIWYCENSATVIVMIKNILLS